jgi:glycine hydroxymethyltransferase
MGAGEMERIADWMDRVAGAPADDTLLARIDGEVRELCARFPAPGILI